ncbi:protein folding in endoplasmic reticulum, variant 2 [Balamuthia mandrillaris]
MKTAIVVLFVVAAAALLFVYSDPFFVLTEAPVKGVVDDCCCEVETVNKQADQIHEQLAGLKARTFFKYFKINLFRDCPFWAEEYLCSMSEEGGGCGVCACPDDEIPTPWRLEESQKLDTTVDTKLGEWEDEEDEVWTYQDHTDKDSSYVNLELNPERYTGYSGFNATRIWKAIYSENCFHHEDGDEELCFEERVFYRLMSGLHASTTASICENFHTPAGGWSPNVEMYRWRLAKEPERLKNIYFTFLFLLRATSRASEFLKSYNYDTGTRHFSLSFFCLLVSSVFLQVLSLCFIIVSLFLLSCFMCSCPHVSTNDQTGNPEDDQKLREQMANFLSVDLLHCNAPTFNESDMFSLGTWIQDDQLLEEQHQQKQLSILQVEQMLSQKQELKKEFRAKFHNISLLMECVACESCKLHAKLQVLGIGTALKILLAENEVKRHGIIQQLQRNEIIALINTLAKFSDSIQTIHKMNVRLAESHADKVLHLWLPRIAAATCLAAPMLLFLARRRKKEGESATPSSQKKKTTTTKTTRKKPVKVD